MDGAAQPAGLDGELTETLRSYWTEMPLTATPLSLQNPWLVPAVGGVAVALGQVDGGGVPTGGHSLVVQLIGTQVVPSPWKPSPSWAGAMLMSVVPVPLKTTARLPGGFGMLSSRFMKREAWAPLGPVVDSLPTTWRLTAARTPPVGAS